MRFPCLRHKVTKHDPLASQDAYGGALPSTLLFQHRAKHFTASVNQTSSHETPSGIPRFHNAKNGNQHSKQKLIPKVRLGTKSTQSKQTKRTSNVSHTSPQAALAGVRNRQICGRGEGGSGGSTPFAYNFKVKSVCTDSSWLRWELQQADVA